jgi:endonuclease/exonuclease/phosphatase family metal-dependent hydrolase
LSQVFDGQAAKHQTTLPGEAERDGRIRNLARILSYNIRKGGSGRERELAAVVGACAPDLVILQEATKPEVVEAVAGTAGMAQWASQRGQSLAFMSRKPVQTFGWHQPRISRHAFLEVQLSGTEARVFGVHLSAVHAAWTERRRIMELRALLKAIVQHQQGFHLLTGDFNTLAPGELLDLRKLPSRLRALVWLSGGRVRWRTIQIVLDAGYIDAYRAGHPGVPGFTFPTWDPHARLDYFFTPSTHSARVQSCEVMNVPGVREASDHLPLMSIVEVS